MTNSIQLILVFLIGLTIVFGPVYLDKENERARDEKLLKAKQHRVLQQQREEQLRRGEEQLLREEDTKIPHKVDVDHDSDPETVTYPIMMDASRSKDPDQGDKLSFSWVQTDGPKVELSDTTNAVVTFDGAAGEYTFEVIATDDYGKSTLVSKTVKIGPEPNEAPIVILTVKKWIKNLIGQ